MAAKTWLDTSNGMEHYAERHGAKLDKATGQWYVLGNPPPELFNLVVENKEPARPRSAGMRPLGQALDGVADQITDTAGAKAPQRAYVPPADALRARVEEVVKLAAETIKNNDGVMRWLSTPKQSLGNATPIQAMKTLQGCDSVEKLLRQLYS